MTKVSVENLKNVVRGAALRTWGEFRLVRAEVVDCARVEGDHVPYAADSRSDVVLLQWVKLHLGTGDVLPVRMGYTSDCKTILLEEMDSNYRIYYFCVTGTPLVEEDPADSEQANACS